MTTTEHEGDCLWCTASAEERHIHDAAGHRRLRGALLPDPIETRLAEISAATAELLDAYTDGGYLPALEWADWITDITNRMTTQLVANARNNGATWERIGAALDMTKQAAQQRFGKL